MKNINNFSINVGDIDKALTLAQAQALCQQLYQHRSPKLENVLVQLITQVTKVLNSHSSIDDQTLKTLNDAAQSWYQRYFNVLMHQQKYAELTSIAQRANTQFPDWAIGHYSLAVAYRYLRHPKLAKQALEHAISLAPQHISWQRLLGTMCKEEGNFTQATQQFNRCIAMSTEDAESYWLRSDNQPRLSSSELDNLNTLLDNTNRHTSVTANINAAHIEKQAYACFTLFRHFDALQEYPQALQYLHQGNKALSKLYPFELNKELNEHKHITNTFDAKLLAPKLSVKSKLPTASRQKPLGDKSIFICGLPRTGTTLIEQILASHTDVNAGDELFYLAQACNELLQSEQIRLPYPKWASTLSEQQWHTIGQQYLAKCQHLAKNRFLTDKMPLNYKAIGIMANALPAAKVIICQRSKADTIWGCYKQILGRGNAFANNLTSLDGLYDAHVALIKHWQQHLGKRLYTLKYERLVSQPEQELKALCNFIGIDYQPQMLNFYEQPSTVHTISSTQVRKPLSNKHQGQWLNYQLNELLKL